MAQALILVNGSPGPNTDVPINTSVALSNQNTGGETTYLWTILDQPAGATDSLSASNIQSPSFTPRKEGTYLLQIVVNAGPSQLVNRTVVAVRQVKTRTRVPAAGETTEAATATGWALAVDALLQLVDTIRADPGVTVCVAGASGLAINDVVKMSGQATILSGLPGQQTLPSVTKALATTSADMDQSLGVVLGAVDGGAIASGSIVYVRRFGQVSGLSGSPVVGDPVYASDTATLALAAGTVPRKVGTVIASAAGVYAVFLDGSYCDLGAIGSTPDVRTWGNSATTASPSTTEYLDPNWYRGAAAGTEIVFEVPYACVASRLRVRAATGPTGGNVVFTLRKNAADTALTATLLAAGTSATDLVNTVTFAAGDRISMKAASGTGVSVGCVNVLASLQLRRL